MSNTDPNKKQKLYTRHPYGRVVCLIRRRITNYSSFVVYCMRIGETMSYFCLCINHLSSNCFFWEFHIFIFFFWYHKTDLNQTWQKCSLDGQEKTFKHFFHSVYVKIKSSHGGHLEFPISKRFTSLVQVHPMIIPAKPQFNWLSGF
jgi:hypothetical protein